MAFQPKNDDHAVVEVTFTLELDRPVPSQAINALQGPTRLTVPWAEELPAMNSNPGIMQAGLASIGAIAFQGVQFAFMKPNGQPMWTLKLAGSEIAVECTTYTRWVGVWGKAWRHLRDGLAFLRQYDNTLAIRGAKLLVNDQFETGEALYNPRELIRDGTVLGEAPFKGSPLWHSYSGWFEPFGDQRTLQVLNIHVAGVADPNAPSEPLLPPYTITVSHMQQKPFRDAATEDDFSAAVEAMHQHNKTLLRQILSDEMCQRIGLGA